MVRHILLRLDEKILNKLKKDKQTGSQMQKTVNVYKSLNIVY
jgi:hypothetical protein